MAIESHPRGLSPSWPEPKRVPARGPKQKLGFRRVLREPFRVPTAFSVCGGNRRNVVAVVERHPAALRGIMMAMVDRNDVPEASVPALRSATDEVEFQRANLEHRDAVFRFAWRYLGDRQGAEDITQEVFLTLWRERARYEERGKQRAYLFQIARNRCLATLEKSNRAAPAAPSTVGGAVTTRSLLARELRESLERLDWAQREVVVLRYLQGFELSEIASFLDVPVGTVKSRLHRALRILRQEWS